MYITMLKLKNIANLFLITALAMSAFGLEFKSRSDWGARSPKQTKMMPKTPNLYIIHHSESPAYCGTTDDCIKKIKSIQNYHMDIRNFDDIGYNFLIGGDGYVYVGRDWGITGAHAGPLHNNKSIGICLIGNYQNELPPKLMLDTAHELIDYGVKNGLIEKKYNVIGHRQVRNTDCPGNELYKEVTTWPRFYP